MKIKAICERSGNWWAVTIPDIAGGLHTQARRLDQVPEMVIDAVTLATDTDAADIEVEVVPITSVDDAIEAALEARVKAESAAESYAQAVRDAARALIDHGASVRDVGALLGISPQRVSQLTR